MSPSCPNRTRSKTGFSTPFGGTLILFAAMVLGMAPGRTPTPSVPFTVVSPPRATHWLPHRHFFPRRQPLIKTAEEASPYPSAIPSANGDKNFVVAAGRANPFPVSTRFSPPKRFQVLRI